MYITLSTIFIDFYFYIGIIIFKKILFIFSERKGEGEREGEKHQCVVVSHVPPTGHLTNSPGMCPNWESNWHPLVHRPVLNPLSYIS